MFIAGLGTAAPLQSYQQIECWKVLQGSEEFHRLQPRSRAILRKVLTGQNGIRSRHLALNRLTDAFQLDPDSLQERFLSHAPALATEAAQQALASAHLRASDIDAVLISTCTGYLCPGLTSYVSERLRLRSDVLALDLVGLGCGAALPNLRTAEALLLSGRCAAVMSICVEICSAAFYLDDDPGVLISACLFGDGAGAAVLASEPNGYRRLELKRSDSLHAPSDRDLLRFEQRQGMLRNILSPQVPRLAGEQVDRLLRQTLGEAGLGQEQVKAWMVHPGGRDVLQAIQQRLGLTSDDLRWSASVLEQFGNLSSASLFFVLKTALEHGAAGGYWWMTSFGAGFSVHGALWEVE